MRRLFLMFRRWGCWHNWRESDAPLARTCLVCIRCGKLYGNVMNSAYKETPIEKYYKGQP